jgi:hypothetical protein
MHECVIWRTDVCTTPFIDPALVIPPEHGQELKFGAVSGLLNIGGAV